MTQILPGKYLRIAGGLLLFYFGVRYALPLIAPFIAGLSAAAVVQKPAGILSERIPKLSARACRVILTAVLIFGVTAVMGLVLCSAVEGAVSFCPGIPDRLGKIRQMVADASVAADGTGSWNRFTAFVASGASWCMDFLAENYRHYLPSVLGRSTRIISGLPSLLTAAVFAVLSALFASGDYDKVTASVKELLPSEAADTLSLVLRTSVSTCAALIRTYGIIMLITFAELSAGLGIMSLMGYGTGSVITTALIISLIDILPILGTGTVLIPWAIFELLSGRTVSGIMLLAIFAVTEIVRNLLEPKLIAGRLELHPFFTLLGVYVGVKLFGTVGIIVMPPAMMIFRQLHLTNKKADEADRE